MRFVILGHFIDDKNITLVPREWFHKNIIVSPEVDIEGTKGNLLGLTLTPREIVSLPRERVRKMILDAAVFARNQLDADIVQLGGLITSVTNGGKWLIEQEEYTGLANHGDSYTAAVTCQAVMKALNRAGKTPSNSVLAVVGAYGIIGEAVSRILVPRFKHSILVGRRKEKLQKLEEIVEGDYETTVNLKTKGADVIVTATSHPTALLDPHHLKKNAIVVDVSQPPNLSKDVCKKRPDVCRVDGGYVDFPAKCHLPIPGMPPKKNFACIAEVIMQAMENERKNHVGSIDLKHLRKTERWAKKYGFILRELTSFGEPLIETCGEG